MICVICEEEKVEPYYVDSLFHDTDHRPCVVCKICRHLNYPNHMNSSQYIRYWIAFSVKWRKENT
jgi:hypothetical protein